MPRIAIIGATAAGLYASDLLMRCAHQIPGVSMHNPLHIDVYDALPAPTSISTAAHATAQAAPASVSAPAASLRLLGNVQITTAQRAGDVSIAELNTLYDAVLWAANPAAAPTDVLRIADLNADIAVHYAVGEVCTQLSSSTTGLVVAATAALDARQVAYTVWENPLDLPTTWNLQQWQHEISLSHGAPICF